ncbi:protein unc-13 homolog 4B isoform X3 [Neodiprion virginianus]|uniref:protein unc-13 homolog 4B isoform X3 n=1 Tax=Neodiprion virginianus TaxID=2961670 RepID=UPI001EE69AB6|nr:protein unc-13 homolog 4B isoform X3 [Neodiprion virginianus]
MILTKKAVWKKVKSNDIELKNDPKKCNFNKSLYNINMEDSILTDSRYIPIASEFPYIRTPYKSAKASTSYSMNTNSMDSFVLVTEYEAGTAKEFGIEEWEIARRRDLAESLIISGMLQKRCKPKKKSYCWFKFKKHLKKVGVKVQPGIEIGIQAADGGFFENLGTLFAAKARAQAEAEGPIPTPNEDEQEKELSDEEGSVHEPTEALLESDSDRDENEHSHNLIIESVGWNVEELYASLVYLTQHQIGFDVTNECSQETLLNHLQGAFKIDNQTHEQVLEQAQNMEPPEMHLNVEVIEAKELVSKDADGKSDPFCALYLESVPTRRYNTAVKTSTLSPVWEEHFELPLEDAENDVLNLEVWDFDAAETVPEKMSKVKDVKGVRGLVKLAKEIALTATTGNHDNEFIGKCQIALKDIPVTGHTMWYSLEKKNKSKRRGVVRLKLAFSAEHNAQVAAQEHRHLLRILLLHEIESQKIEKYCWCGRWSGPAEAIILQHSAQRGLLARNVTLAQWVEYIRVHQEHPLSFTLFNKLALDLLRPMENNLFSDDEIRLFWDSTRKLLHSCLNSVRKLRRSTAGDKNTINQLGAILGILSSIDSLQKPEDLDLFPANMYGWLPQPEGPRADVLQALQDTVIQGAEEWYDYVLKNNSADGVEDEDMLKYYIKVIQLIRADLQRAIEFYDKVFIKQVNFPYARTLYVHYEKRISDMCMIIVEDVCARLKRIEIENSDGTSEELALGTTLFELYLTLQRYAILGHVLCADGLEYMKIQSYHEWFRAGVAHWLDIAVFKALRRIDRAVEFDTLQPVDSSVQYSSSAVDTLTIFYQIKVFWTQLAWPDVEGSYTFIAKIIDDICRCSVEYADKMARKAEEATQQEYDLENNSSVYEKKFEVSNAWCFAINNIDYIRTSIGPLAEDLGLQSIVECLAANKTQQEAERCRQTLQLVIDNATDTVSNKIIELLEVVASKMTPAMSRYLEEGAELIDTTSNAMDRLLQYLDSNITTLHDNLNETNFERVLLVIWEIMSKTLYDLVNNNLERRRPPSFYANLHRTLHTLIRFFNLGADETSNIHILEKIEELLKIHGLETAALIHRYNQERVQEQKAIEESRHGQLTVRAYFIDNSLNIQIMNARNLTPMDSNGKMSTLERKLRYKSKTKTKLKDGRSSKCDPYVKIRLLPEERFVHIKQPKTRVHKETLFPLFDETFSIALTTELRETKEAIIAFEVKDKDFLRTRFMAEAFLPFGEIPETGPDRDFDSLEQIHLKLSRPTMHNSDAIRALEHRKGDDRAVDFMSKLNTKIESR